MSKNVIAESSSVEITVLVDNYTDALQMVDDVDSVLISHFKREALTRKSVMTVNGKSILSEMIRD